MQVNNTVGNAMEMANNFVTRQIYATGHVWFISMDPSFRVKIANFSSSFCPSIPKRDLLDTKKTTPNIDVLNEQSHPVERLKSLAHICQFRSPFTFLYVMLYT